MERRKFLKSLFLSPALLLIPPKDEYDYSDKLLSNAVVHIHAPGVVLKAKSVHNSIFHMHKEENILTIEGIDD